MKKILMLTVLVIIVCAALTGCSSQDISGASAATTENIVASSTRVVGLPYHICPETEDCRVYETGSIPVNQINGEIKRVGNDLVTVTLDIDDVDVYIMKNEPALADGFVGVTLVTSSRLVTSEGTPKPALVGAYDEVVSQLHQKGIDGTVCLTLYEVDEFTMDFIRVRRGW